MARNAVARGAAAPGMNRDFIGIYSSDNGTVVPVPIGATGMNAGIGVTVSGTTGVILGSLTFLNMTTSFTGGFLSRMEGFDGCERCMCRCGSCTVFARRGPTFFEEGVGSSASECLSDAPRGVNGCMIGGCGGRGDLFLSVRENVTMPAAGSGSEEAMARFKLYGSIAMDAGSATSVCCNAMVVGGPGRCKDVCGMGPIGARGYVLPLGRRSPMVCNKSYVVAEFAVGGGRPFFERAVTGAGCPSNATFSCERREGVNFPEFFTSFARCSTKSLVGVVNGMLGTSKGSVRTTLPSRGFGLSYGGGGKGGGS